MRVKVRDLRRGLQGLHPSEAMVLIDTLTGPEELVIFAPSESLRSIDVGYPIAITEGNFLVELPSETSKGAWRVWVGPDSAEADVMEAAE
jgi:hypothetical protein